MGERTKPRWLCLQALLLLFSFFIYFCLHVLSSFAPLPQRKEDPITVFMGVPTMYSYLLNAYDAMAPEQQAAAHAAAGRLRLTVSGSAACPLPVMQRWEELSGPGSLSQGSRHSVPGLPVAMCISDEQERHTPCGKSLAWRAPGPCAALWLPTPQPRQRLLQRKRHGMQASGCWSATA